MGFEWDEDKNQRNIEKHGIDFTDAPEIWREAPVQIARRARGGEERITAIASFRGQYIAVTYTERGGNVRLISARRANRKERPHR